MGRDGEKVGRSVWLWAVDGEGGVGRGEARAMVNLGGESLHGDVAGRHGAMRVKSVTGCG